MIFSARKTPSLEGARVEFASYANRVSSAEYDFGLMGGNRYALFGVEIKLGLAWYWVVSADLDLIFAPAAIFVADSHILVNERFLINVHGGEAIQVIPESFVALDNWFERYLENDSEICLVVNAEIARLALYLEKV